jgi:hypothetical protein
MQDWFKVAMRRDVVVRSLQLGAIVGTLANGDQSG